MLRALLMAALTSTDAAPRAPLAIDLTSQLAMRSGISGFNTEVAPFGSSLGLEAGGLPLGEGFTALGSVSLGLWGRGRASPLGFDNFSLLAATSVRLGPTTRYELPAGSTRLQVQLGPRYHLQILTEIGGFAGETRTVLQHGWAVDLAGAWLLPLWSRFLVGARFDLSVGPTMLAGGLGVVIAFRL
jgi:hypothetical protein